MLNKEVSSYFATHAIVQKRTNFGIKFGKFRSVWEQRFAQYLDDMGIEYKFENEGIKVKNASDENLHYIPDFYLPKYHVYIEFVNNMCKRTKYKVFWMMEQHPDKKIIIITKTDFKKLIRGELNIKNFL